MQNANGWRISLQKIRFYCDEAFDLNVVIVIVIVIIIVIVINRFVYAVVRTYIHSDQRRKDQSRILNRNRYRNRNTYIWEQDSQFAN